MWQQQCSRQTEDLGAALQEDPILKDVRAWKKGPAHRLRHAVRALAAVSAAGFTHADIHWHAFMHALTLDAPSHCYC